MYTGIHTVTHRSPDVREVATLKKQVDGIHRDLDRHLKQLSSAIAARSREEETTYNLHDLRTKISSERGRLEAIHEQTPKLMKGIKVDAASPFGRTATWCDYVDAHLLDNTIGKILKDAKRSIEELPLTYPDTCAVTFRMEAKPQPSTPLHRLLDVRQVPDKLEQPDEQEQIDEVESPSKVEQSDTREHETDGTQNQVVSSTLFSTIASAVSYPSVF